MGNLKRLSRSIIVILIIIVGKGKAADQLELQFEYRFTGYGTLETVMNTWQQSKSYGKADQHLLA